MQDWLVLGGLVGALLVVLVITLVLAAVFLKFGLSIAGAPETDFGTTFVTALLMAIVSVIPCLGIILQWYFIKSRHGLGWGGAIVAWIIAGLIPLLIALGIAFAFGWLGGIMGP